MLKIGDKAPDFTLEDSSHRQVTLSHLVAKKVILYFYPKDNTPGCTTEALEFTRLITEFSRAQTVVIGVSKDSCESHAKFSSKHKLEVILLSDPEHKVQELYGVWQQKSMMGKKYMGTERTTFLIGQDGSIKQIWQNVKAKGHAQNVLDTLQ